MTSLHVYNPTVQKKQNKKQKKQKQNMWCGGHNYFLNHNYCSYYMAKYSSLPFNTLQ